MVSKYFFLDDNDDAISNIIFFQNGDISSAVWILSSSDAKKERKFNLKFFYSNFETGTSI